MMKQLLAALACAAVVGCAAPPEPSAAEDPSQALVLTTETGDFHTVVEGVEGAATAKLAVEGMTCGACAETVGSAVAALKGVAEVDVSLEDNTVTVRYDDAEQSPSAMLEALGAEVREYKFSEIDGDPTES